MLLDEKGAEWVYNEVTRQIILFNDKKEGKALRVDKYSYQEGSALSLDIPKEEKLEFY